jgi:excisionase family DNA binding protein
MVAPNRRATGLAGPLGQDFIQLLATAITRNAVPVADKLLLSLPEAAQLSGLARGHLREAIATGKLRAKVIGRGWKMSRADLEGYTAKLLK